MDLSGLGAITSLDTHGAGLLIGFSSIMSCLIISSITWMFFLSDGTERILVGLLLT